MAPPMPQIETSKEESPISSDRANTNSEYQRASSADPTWMATRSADGVANT